MFALRMLETYAYEILKGEKSFDVRSFPTPIRGDIAIMDTKSKKILGYVELTNVRAISYEEYCAWHQSGIYEGLTFEIPEEKRQAQYYAYDLLNPRFEPHPYKITPKENEKVFVDIGTPPMQETLF